MYLNQLEVGKVPQLASYGNQEIRQFFTISTANEHKGIKEFFALQSIIINIGCIFQDICIGLIGEKGTLIATPPPNNMTPPLFCSPTPTPSLCSQWERS